MNILYTGTDEALVFIVEDTLRDKFAPEIRRERNTRKIYDAAVNKRLDAVIADTRNIGPDSVEQLFDKLLKLPEPPYLIAIVDKKSYDRMSSIGIGDHVHRIDTANLPHIIAADLSKYMKGKSDENS